MPLTICLFFPQLLFRNQTVIISTKRVEKTNLPSQCDAFLKLGQTNSCPIDHEELTAIDWNLGIFFLSFAHPLIIRANRAHPYAYKFPHMLGIEERCTFDFFSFFFFHNMKIIIPSMLLFRPDHLSCHVKHVHSSERPFKCQVTVRPFPFSVLIILAFLICLCVCVCVSWHSSMFWTFSAVLWSQACTSAFATKDRLRSHMIRHEGKVTCSICGKMLSAAYITSHLKTHGQTNFNSCNKGTVYLTTLFKSNTEWISQNKIHSQIICFIFCI